MSDADKTALLGELVMARHPLRGNGGGEDEVAGRWVVLPEVRNGAGFSANRSADYVAISLWPSDGLRFVGYEVKASRSDLKRELEDLSKAEESGSFCDEWWLVVWSEKMLDGLTIPAEWGILARTADDGCKTVRKATRRPQSATIDRDLAVVLVRAAARLSVGAWRFGEAIRHACHNARASGERSGESTVRHDITKRLGWLTDDWRRATGANVWERPSAEQLVDFAAARVKEIAVTP